MIQEVQFQGLSHSPSDYDAQDGELGTCLNLICEDGSLKPIPEPQETDSCITLPEGASIELTHKVTHNNETHCHYIIKLADGTWCWAEKGGNGTFTTIDLDGFTVNAIASVGNMLCFVGDRKTVNGLWKKNKYIVFSREDFVYSLSFTSTQSYVRAVAEMGDEYWNDVTYSYFGTDRDEGDRRVSGFNYEQIRTAFNATDAIVNKSLTNAGEEWVNGVVLGVAAVRLYDGSYYNISNIFTLAPEAIANNFYFYSDEYNNQSSKCFTYEAYIHKDSITVNMDIQGLEDIIQGIDIFITEGDYYLDIDRPYKSPTFIVANADDTTDSHRNGYVTLLQQDSQTIYDTIDNKTFYHALYVDKNNFGKQLNIKRPLKTEEAISLSDFYRTDFGGSVIATYNNRLHIGNINSGFFDTFSISTSYCKRQRLFGKYLDLPLSDTGAMTNFDGVDVEIIAVITASNLGTIYNYGKIQYPLAPIITIPITDADQAVLYMKKDGLYYTKTVTLHSSSSFGASIFVNCNSDGYIAMLQINDVKRDGTTYTDGDGGGSISGGGGSYGTRADSDSSDTSSSTVTFTASRNDQWQDSSEAKWAEIMQLYETSEISKNSPSLVKVSEAENPLVFPASNSVQIGSSTITALAANTQPISEGQFGEAPLYAFTDEGVWVLMTSSAGTYDSRQPTNRDICSNPKGILQTDNAVLYPTERGIMMLQGRSTTCITDQLDGYPFDFTQLYKNDYAKKVLTIENISESEVKYVRFRKYLESADMIYDYYDSRIIVFNPSYEYAYVYSLKSHQWGTMKNTFSKRVNIYPESYAINTSGKIVDVYTMEPTDDVSYLLCSRPLSLGSPEIHKTIFSAIARGYFRNERGKCGMVLYGSNDLFNWFPIKTSVNKYLRGSAGSPYKYFCIALVGKLSVDESISGMSADLTQRWQNKLR
jgi:hypothetical protein